MDNLPPVHVWPVEKEVGRAELAAFVRAVIAQDAAPREPAQERQDGRPVTRIESAALHDALVASSTPVAPGPSWSNMEAVVSRALNRAVSDGLLRPAQLGPTVAHVKASEAITQHVMDEIARAQPGGADPLLPGLKVAAEMTALRTALAAADRLAEAAVNEDDDNPCRFCNGAWFPGEKPNHDSRCLLAAYLAAREETR